MKIVLFTQTIDNGGISNYFIRMKEALKAHQVDVDLVYFIDNREKKNLKNEKSKFKYLLKNIKDEKPNYIITNWGIETIIAWAISKISFRKVKIISVIHTSPHIWIPNYRNKVKKIIYSMLMKFSFIVTDKCIAVSEGLYNEILNLKIVKKDKIEVCYNPIIDDKFTGKVREKIVGEKINIGIIGWIYDVKNQIEAIKAIKELNDSRYILHIIGGIKDENYYRYLRKEIKSLGLEKQIIFEGIKNNIFEELEKIDIVLLTSKTEALPTVIIESMASGVPVIASNCKFGPEEIIKGEYGVIYELGNIVELVDKIKYIVEDSFEYERINKMGMQRAEDFKYFKIVKCYIKLLEK